MTQLNQKPIFVLGLGAPKAGTTWLYYYLSQQRCTRMGRTKEYRIWNAVDPAGRQFHKVTWQQTLRLSKYPLRYRLQNREGAYERYFRSLTTGDATMTADITPFYAQLSQAGMTLARQRIEAAGFDLRVVFLIRDPVLRCWSSARMQVKERAKRGIRRLGRRTVAPQSVEAFFEDHFRDPFTQRNTRYEDTLAKMAEVFTPAQTYIGAYESMFDDEELQRLSAFLNLPYRPDLRERHVNVGARIQMPQRLMQECYDLYAPTYAYITQTYPGIRKLWLQDDLTFATQG